MNDKHRMQLHETFMTLAMPVVAIFAKRGDSSSGDVGLGLAVTVLLWPITLPMFLIFGPIAMKFLPVRR